MIFHPFCRQFNFLWRSLLCFLGEAMRQDQQTSILKKAQQTKNVIAELDADFPELSPGQFLEILNGDNF